MEDQQAAAVLRIVGRAALELAEVLDTAKASSPATASVTPAPAPPVDPATNLPAYAQKRAKYLMAFVKAGGQLTLPQVTAAAKKAGLGNPGSATSHGYVTKTGPGIRAITEKGLQWLKDNGYDVAA